jgi:predicted methyltransferase
MTRFERKILQLLLRSPASYWYLLRCSDAPAPAFVQTIRDLFDRGLVQSGAGCISLTQEGRNYAGALQALVDITCPTCHGQTVAPAGSFQNLPLLFEQASRGRPTATTEFDQGFILPDQTVARALFLYSRGDLEEQSILLLGDDDLTSVALALTGLAKRITVLEIDTRLVRFLRERQEEYGWKGFEAREYDARNPLPVELAGQFDIFFTDTVETIPGITLFLSRCVEGLKGEGSAGYFGQTRIECALAKWQKIQANLISMNFAVTDIIKDFHEYYLDPQMIRNSGYRITENAPFDPGLPDVNFFLSSLVRVEAVGAPHPLITESVTWERDLYYDEEMWITLD